MKIINNEIITLIPDKGYILTNGEVYSDMVFLGINSSPSEWYDIKIEEVPEDERDTLESYLFNSSSI